MADNLYYYGRDKTGYFYYSLDGVKMEGSHTKEDHNYFVNMIGNHYTEEYK